MNWFDWTLISLWTLSLVLAPQSVGKARKPKTEGDAIIGAVIALLLIVGLLGTRGAFA